MEISNSDYIDFNQKYSYPLQWLYESMPARQFYQQLCYRVNLAMEGKPSRNLYQDEMNSVIERMPDQRDQESLRKECLTLPEGRSFCLADSVQTCANQLAGGVDAYEYQVFDPYGIINDDTEANLEACCEMDYAKNQLGLRAALFTKDLRRYGICAVHVGYDLKSQRNVVKRINPKNIWFDTMYSSTGQERFRGYSTMIDWATLKKMVEEDPNEQINYDLEAPQDDLFDKDGKLQGPPNQEAKLRYGKIKTLNDLDIYVGNINKLAIAPSLQGFSGEFYWDYDHDLRTCYNLNWYHTWATDPKSMTNSGYHGMDVELTVIYDLNRRIEFKIINRRFVIAKNENAFKRNILFPIYDVVNDTVSERIEEFHLDCPLKFQWEEQDAPDKNPFPTSQLFSLLDMHDELCAWRAKRSHVSKILAILRINTNGADASVLRNVMNIMGVTLDSLQGDVKSIMLEYSYDPIDSQIAHIEQTIKEHLNAYNQFDAMEVMGDRASAAESGMAVGAISQGLSTLQNSLMQLYADIARQMISNRVAYSPESEFPIINEGGYSSVTIREMALDAIINVKSKLAKRIYERQAATNAVTLLPILAQGIFNQNGVAMLVEQATAGLIPRKMAQTFMQQPQANPAEVALAQQQAQNDALMLQQNQMAYEQNPLPYEIDSAMSQSSPDEIDELIAGVSEQPDGSEEIDIEALMAQATPLEMAGQDGAMSSTMAGQTADFASQLANPNSMV